MVSLPSTTESEQQQGTEFPDLTSDDTTEPVAPISGIPKVVTVEGLSANSALAKLLIHPDDYDTIGLCFTLVGPPGSGKTTLACAAAGTKHGGLTLLLDAEAGSKVVKEQIKAKTVIPTRVPRWQDVQAITNEFKLGKHKGVFGTVVLDNLCEMQRQHLKYVTPVGETPEFKQWNLNTNAIRDLVRDWRTIAETQGINVIFIGWDGDDDSKRVVKQSIAMTPALQKEFPGIVDTIGILSPVDGKPDMRVIDFTPSTRSIAKFRRSRNENSRKIPYKIQYTLDKLPLADMLASIRVGAVWPAAVYTKNEA